MPLVDGAPRVPYTPEPTPALLPVPAAPVFTNKVEPGLAGTDTAMYVPAAAAPEDAPIASTMTALTPEGTSKDRSPSWNEKATVLVPRERSAPASYWPLTCRRYWLRAKKSREPSPETGSHPGLAGNPALTQQAAAMLVQLLSP
jgi:hypothetical protein